MILIADSGSTQTKWALVTDEATQRFRTPGMNPYYQTEAEMEETIRRALLPQLPPGARVEAVYFYGAGCAFPEKNRSVEKAIQANIPTKVCVQSDLWAAAHALCGTEAGIPCILGTGSNSCLYDGHQICEQVSPLGFILGDEGSGAVLGRKLVGDCLKRQMPAQLVQALFETYGLTPERILEKVYRQPFPNRFLASLVPFIKAHIQEEVMQRLVDEEFMRFFQRNVLMYTGHDRLSIHFVGSVAYHFSGILQTVAQRLSLQIGHIEASPLDGLVEFYRRIHRPL